MDYKNLFENIESEVRSVADFITTESLSFNSDKIEYKGKNDVVSYVDKESERRLVNILEKALPEAGFITEEATALKKGEKYTWIIDPLDGTANFIHGIPTFCISIALQMEDELVFGLIYEMNRDEMFYAWKNSGAWLNGKEIKVSGSKELKQSLLATGFPYNNFDKAESYIKIFSEFIVKAQGVRRIGSAAADLAYVAAGRFDAYFEYTVNIWDIAAGLVILKEAGGLAANFAGSTKSCDLTGNYGIIGGNPDITKKVLEVIKEKFI